LRGGGTKGAYEVGVLKAIVSELDPIEYSYDVVVGVSIGAWNAAFLSIFDKGKEKEAVNFMEGVWNNTTPADLYTWWPYVSVAAGFWRSSFLDSEPLHSKIKGYLDGKTFKRKVAFQSVDVNTGKVVIFDEQTP
jgi:predicted acylesterase/phospholipase RssA